MHYARFSLAFVICNTLLLNLASPLLASTFLGLPRESSKSIAKELAKKRVELDKLSPRDYVRRADILKSMCEIEFRAKPEEAKLENCEQYIDLVATKADFSQDKHDLCIVGTYLESKFSNPAVDQFQTHGAILSKLSKASQVKILEFCEANIMDIMHVYFLDDDNSYAIPHLNRVNTLAYLLQDYPRGKAFFLKVYENSLSTQKVGQAQDDYTRARLQGHKRYITLSWIFPALVSMGNFEYLSGNHENAMNFYRQANEVYSTAKKEFESLWTSNSNFIYNPYGGHYGLQLNPFVAASFVTFQVNFGRDLAKQGKYEEAEQFFLLAIDELQEGMILLEEPSQKLVLAEIASPVYSALQDLYIAQKKYDKALELTDRVRSFAYESNLVLGIDVEETANISGISASDMQKMAINQKSTFVIYGIPELPRYDYSNFSSLDDRVLIWVIQQNGQLHFHSVNVEEAIKHQFLNVITINSTEFTWVLAYVLVVSACGVFLFISRFIKPIKPIIIVAFGTTAGVLLSLIAMKFTVDYFSKSSAIPQMSSSTDTNSEIPLSELIQTTVGFTRGLYTDNTTKTGLVCSPIDKCLEDMYATLIKPVENLLPQNPNDLIVLVPYRSLHSLPFSILKSRDGKYLIEKHTITSSPSLNALNAIYEKSKSVLRDSSNTNYLVVGNPIMPTVKFGEWDEPTELSKLPSAEIEAKEIARLLNVSPLIGASANLDIVTKNFFGSRFIHLATHGIVYEDLDQGSALALTPVQDEGRHSDNYGMLRSSDLVTMKSNAEIAVLSACDTGLGAESLEGNLALTRSFLATGIPTVVSSLWQVPDSSTSDLMVDFYKNLLSSPNKAKSFRQAILNTKERYQDPVYWGAFVMTGLADLPPPNPTAKIAVGYAYCASLRNLEQNTLSNRASYIYAAELHSTQSGFRLKMTNDPKYLPGFDQMIDFNNQLDDVIRGQSYDKERGWVDWNLVAKQTSNPYGKYLEADNKGNFLIDGMQVSTRSTCSWRGRLKFVGAAQAKIQRLR